MLTVSFVLAVAVVLILAHTVGAATISKTFVGKGSFQVFVPFVFNVPWGDGCLKTYRFCQGWPTLDIPSKWVLVQPGEPTYRGFYRFIWTKEIYVNTFTISGELDYFVDMDIWQAIEIEPAEVGMFVENVYMPRNIFHLPINDITASYFILMPNPGMNVTLGGILKGRNFIWMAGKLYGVIISDSRGFLLERLAGQQLRANLDKILIRDTDLVILEYRGEYR